MALIKTFICSHCRHEITVSDEGHPYLRDAAGKRHSFYHPLESRVTEPLFRKETGLDCHKDRKAFEAFLRERGGAEEDHLCLHCGRMTRRDGNGETMRCTRCKRAALVKCWDLEGRPCPKCREGVFRGGDCGIS